MKKRWIGNKLYEIPDAADYYIGHLEKLVWDMMDMTQDEQYEAAMGIFRSESHDLS